ncbi:MAG: type II/IV secretion system protein [Acidobacteria bacterium]|nr:type II/IV secretion system protein [Acidobacteriota bacterium]
MLGKRLLADGIITSAQLEQALAQQRSSGALLGEILLGLNFITQEHLARALAQEAGVSFRMVDGLTPDPSVIAMVPEQFARQYMLVPLTMQNGTLEVLQVNPFDVLAVDELQRLVSRPVGVSCGRAQDVLNLIERSYTDRSSVSELVQEGVDALSTPQVDVATIDSPVVRLLELLINDAIARGATDLHIEPEDLTIRVRHRIDGVLIPSDTIPKELHAPLVSRVKVLAGLDITEQRLPQDGRISQMVNGRRVDLRVATFPTTFGEKVAIRILEKEKLVRGLAELGFSPTTYAIFRDILSRSRGIVLVTGPTGAGKTTTLYSALAYLGSTERNILTVEDPVEYQIPTIRQTQVRPKAGFTYATAIRALLRQDPDIIMIGEIRDPETAQLALRAALSGILVFSTLHTQDSAGAVPRLMDMGLEPYLLASGIVGVIAQRLVRVICPHCKEAASYPAETLKKVGPNPDSGLEFQRGRGCSRCNETGYRGRTGVFEVLVIDPAIHTLIRERGDSRQVKSAAVAAGMTTLMDDALAKAAAGQTTLEEVLRVAYE